MADNLLNNALREVSYAIAPLQQVDSPDRVTRLMAELGYELPGAQNFAALPAQLIGKVAAMAAAVVDLVDAETDDERIEAVGRIISDVTDVASKLGDLSEQLGAPANFLANAPIGELPRRILDYLLSKYLELNHSGPYSFLLLLGITDEIPLPADAAHFQPAFTLRKINWERLPDYFSRPGTLAETIYHWESGFDDALFLNRLERVLRGFVLPGGIYHPNPASRGLLGNNTEIRIPIFTAGDSPEMYSQFGLLIAGAVASGGKKKGLALMPYLSGGAEMAFNLNENFVVEFESTFDLSNAIALIVRPDSGLEIATNAFNAPAEVGEGSIRLTLRKRAGEEELILFGDPGGSRFSLKGFETAIFALKRQGNNDLGFEFGISEAKIVIGTGESDGFLQTVLSGISLEVTFSLGIGITLAGGVYFRGGVALEIPVPAHIALGPIEIQGLLLGIRPADGKFPLSAGATIKLDLGPFQAVVENMGLTFTLSFPDGGGNLGPAQFDLGFKPPTGIGLSLDAGVVRGGGYILFDPENEQYAGALELSILDTIQVTAIAVITTRFPDGTKGFSLLLIVAVTFSPGISLSMGFFLSGLGGMIGINRTLNAEALREGVRNGAVDNIMFPENVIQNITRIISDIRTIFPPKQDQFMLGFMLRITWGVPSLVIIDFGLIVEFANPVRIAILGVLKIVLPTEEAAILRIQVNFVGIIDFDKGELSFDASLFGSRILTFTLEGDMAVRLNWGAEKMFLLSVGGFHPAFKPPAGLTNMRRLGLVILPDNPRLACTTYFAVTSNTVQFGAKVELRAEVAGFSVEGMLGFDVLFQFSPFKFIAHIYASVAIKAGGATLFSIRLDFQLEGPTPWIASGTGSISILFFEISVSFRIQWGEERQEALPDIQVLPRLLDALQQDRNWQVEIPSNRFDLVSLRELKLPEGIILLQSFGSLSIRQNILPLDLDITRFGDNNPQDIKRASLAAVRIENTDVVADAVQDSFAPANFKTMSDDDKLKSPSYAPQNSGIRVRETDEIRANYALNRRVEYEVHTSDYDDEAGTPLVLFKPLRLGKMTYRADWFGKMALGGAVGKSALSQENKVKRSAATSPQAEKVDTAPQFAIMNAETMTAFAHAEFSGGDKAQADEVLTAILSANPNLKGKLRVAEAYQMAL